MDLSNINKTIDKISNNKFFITIVSLFLTLYAGLAGPKLPNFIRNLFKNEIFRVAILTLIVYKGNKDPRLSLILAISFTLTMNYIREIEVKEKFSMLKNMTKEQKDEWISKLKKNTNVKDKGYGLDRKMPTLPPTTEKKTQVSTQEPTQEPTQAPTQEPTQAPTEEPTEEPKKSNMLLIIIIVLFLVVGGGLLYLSSTQTETKPKGIFDEISELKI